MEGIKVVYGMLEQARSVKLPQKRYDSRDIPKTVIWAHLGLWGPLEAIRGQTRQTMVGIKVVYGILEQVGSVQRAWK